MHALAQQQLREVRRAARAARSHKAALSSVINQLQTELCRSSRVRGGHRCWSNQPRAGHRLTLGQLTAVC